MKDNDTKTVKNVVSVKLILDDGVSVDDLRRFKEEYGPEGDYKECLQLDCHRDSSGSKNSCFVAFEGFGVLADDDAKWLMDDDRLDEVRECRIASVAEESEGGCTLDLVFIDYEATRRKQRNVVGLVLSDDGHELRSVPCDITEFEFPASVRKIGDYAFHGCSELVGIEIPGHIETIGMLAFGACSKLKKVVIQSGCKHIGRAAFADCEELLEALLPDTVKEIEPLAFSGDRKLVKVRMPGNLNEFGFGVFADCPAFPDKMVYSGDRTQLLQS